MCFCRHILNFARRHKKMLSRPADHWKYLTPDESRLLYLAHPRTQGLFGKDPGIGWSRDSTKIKCPRGSGKVSNYMLPQKMLNFKYQEWDFTIYSSKRPLTSILYLCLLLNYKNTVAFYKQSSQETNKMYTLNFEVGYSQSQTYFHIKLVSRQRLHISLYLFLKYAIRFVVWKRW
jgi:hypothetical protein